MRRSYTFSISVELDVWQCARCGRETSADPTELRLKPAWTTNGQTKAWECSGWRCPERWLEASWGTGERLHACPDCALYVQADLEKYARQVKLP